MSDNEFEQDQEHIHLNKVDIRNSLHKKISGGFNSKIKINNNCFWRVDFKFAKVNDITRCFICQAGASHKIGMLLKPNYNNSVLERSICQKHRDTNICGCRHSDTDLPVLIAVCNYSKSEKDCICFSYDDQTQKPIKPSHECSCIFEHIYLFEKANPSQICSVCENQASVKTKTIFGEKGFCEKHKTKLGCSYASVLCESAPCQFMTKKSNCLFYSGKN